MKKMIIMLAILTVACGVFGQSLIYYWNFNANTPATDANWSQPIAATIGSGQISYTFANAVSFTGTTINGTDGEVNGGSFCPQGGTDNVNNGLHFTITAPTTGYDNIVVTYPTRKTSTGFNAQEIKYTVDGTNWLTKETVSLVGFENNWVATQLITIDFAGVAGVGNNPNFAIRVILTGATSNVGNNRFDNIQITGLSQGSVAAPVFDPPAGVYSTPQNVSITCTTPNSTIRYTTDGTTPNASSTLYTAPIPVSTTTTIKAIAFATGLDPSVVVTAVYSYATVVSNLTQLRSQPAGTGAVITVSGEVILTFKQTFRNQKYVQDGGAAILIDDPSGIMGSGYNVNDGITGITGTIAMYTGMLQFTPTANPGPATSTNNTVSAPYVSIADLNNNFAAYQGKLVTLNNVNIVGASGNFASGANYTIADPSGQIVFRTQFYDVDYIDTPVPTNNFSVKVICFQFNTTLQVAARSLEDFGPVPNEDPSITPVITELIGNYPNPFNPETTIVFATDKADLVQIDIYNQKGQIVRSYEQVTPGKGIHQITWNGTDNKGTSVGSGVYYFRMRSGKFSSTKKMILMK